MSEKKNYYEPQVLFPPGTAGAFPPWNRRCFSPLGSYIFFFLFLWLAQLLQIPVFNLFSGRK